MSRTLTLRPPAKINLSLRVGPRRADGFHDVQTILQAIDLTDTLRLTARRGAFHLAVRGRDVPTDDTNLVSRAAVALWRATGRAGDPRDVQITLDKNIPVAAGLGGGSADAAAALVGLNAVWKLGWPRARLIELAAQLGSDVPFFLVGGAALGSGRGDHLLPLADVTRLGLVILRPPFGVSTVEAYRWLDEDRAARKKSRAALQAPPEMLDVGWPTGRVQLVNDLQDPVRRRHPDLTAALEGFRREGAQATAMSGSGSAVFGVFPAPAAARAARRFQRPGWFVRATRTLSRRETDRRMGLW